MNESFDEVDDRTDDMDDFLRGVLREARREIELNQEALLVRREPARRSGDSYASKHTFLRREKTSRESLVCPFIEQIEKGVTLKDNLHLKTVNLPHTKKSVEHVEKAKGDDLGCA